MLQCNCILLHVELCNNILIHGKSCNCMLDWCKLEVRFRYKEDKYIGENNT